MSTPLLRNATARDWLPYQPAPDAPFRLVCLPFAGGGASRFLGLARQLAPQIGVYPVQFPGRETRAGDPPYADAGELVAALVPVVAGLADRPYAVLGYSLGSAYGYELVRAMCAQGLPAPRALIAVAAGAPHTRAAEHLGDAPEAVLRERMRQWQALPPEIEGDPDLLAAVLATVRIDLGTWERYGHDISTWVKCPVFCYAGQSDPTVARPQLAGWRCRTSVATRFRTFPGDHFFGFDQPDVVAAAIRTDLAPHL